MRTDTAARQYTAFLGFAVLLLIPSFDTFLKYFGIGGVVAYFASGLLALLLVWKVVLPFFQSKITDRQADILAIFTFTALTIVVSLVYPLAHSGRFGRGSDADDALLIAGTKLLNGEYPYYLLTYLGNMISPMPGAVLLAVPFVALGIIAIQNVFWLGVLFVTVRHYMKSSKLALALIWLLLLLTPTVLQNLFTGADYVSNSIYVLVFMWMMVTNISDPESPEWKRLLPSVLLGVALSSRSSFLVLMPLLFSILGQNAGWVNAIKYLAVSQVICLSVTVPLWIYDPAGFTPLIVQSMKVTELATVLPFAGVIIPLSGILLASALAFQKLETDCMAFFRNCAIVQLFILLFTSGIWSLKLGYLDLFVGQSGYGMFALFFGAVAGWVMLYRNVTDSSLVVPSPNLIVPSGTLKSI
ncbi:MAG: hypothetical protein PSX80_06215 [bacterium]|nr:hypothetical protein [bacterium]